MTTAFDTPMIIKKSKGVVLLIGPWNYPINMIILPLIPILAAGNTVIIKPSELAKNTAQILDELIGKYFDKRHVTVIQGDAKETSELLKERFDHIMYTGSTAVGKIIMKAASEHLTPVTLELGGKSPVVVEDENVDIKIAAKRISWGKWLNCGQTCLAPDYILTTSKLKSELIKGMIDAVKEFYGLDAKNTIDYSKIINERHFDRLKSLLEKSKGKIHFQGGELDRETLFFPPIILEVEKDDILMDDEIFGPIFPIVIVDDLDDAIAFMNSKEKPLASYFFVKDFKKLDRLLNETISGGVTINDVLLHFTVDTLPFGGIGNSGIGRYHGKFGFDTFTHERSVLKRGFFGESLMLARYPPFTPEKFKQMAKITGTRRSMPKFIKIIFPIILYFILGIFIGILFF